MVEVWFSTIFKEQEKGELLNLPFFPFVFSPFALFTGGGEGNIETRRQKAIESLTTYCSSAFKSGGQPRTLFHKPGH